MGKDKAIAARMTAIGCIGAREWDIILASQHEEQNSCKDKKEAVKDAGSTARQETCWKSITSSRKHKAGKMPMTTGNCCTDTATMQRRLRTVEGMRHKPQTLEEPCAGKLARTVLKQRRGERFPRLL
jgi:hypothetical protein